MMMVPETSVIFNQPTQVKFRKDFINFSHRKIFGFYFIDSLTIDLDSQHKESGVDYTYIAIFVVK
jgi:hypothetical protein